MRLINKFVQAGLVLLVSSKLSVGAPPEIDITAYKPGTRIPSNTGVVQLSWAIAGVDTMSDMWSSPGQEVLEPGSGGWQNGDHVTPARYSTSLDGSRGSTNIFLSA